jgi:hypothetical protein
MNDLLVAAARTFGIPGLSFKLDRESQRRVVLVSVLPALVVCALLVIVGLAYAFGPEQDMPEAWFRVSLVSSTASTAFLPVAIAFLFASGIGTWNSAAGSWMFVIGLSLAVIAMGLAMVGTFLFGAYDTLDAFNWHANTWLLIAADLGFLSIGYFFVAFRALTPSPEVGPYQGSPYEQTAAEEAPGGGPHTEEESA